MIKIANQGAYLRFVDRLAVHLASSLGVPVPTPGLQHAMREAAGEAEADVEFGCLRMMKPGHPVPSTPDRLGDLTTDEITDLVTKAVRGAFSSEVFANAVADAMLIDAQDGGRVTTELWRALTRRIIGEV